MACPMCGMTSYQSVLGSLGSNTVIRCGGCGSQYFADDDDGFDFHDDMEVDYSRKPVASRSEWGSFRYDGDADMKVLRKRAEGAVRYFNNGKPRVDMQTHIFGYPFSIIDNGRLLDNEKAYKGNVIIRALSYHENGVFAGNVTLSYDDDYNDGRGQGGSGAIILDKVTDVRIDGDYLVISGINGRIPIAYRYLIQEKPDEKRFVFPIPKGGKVPEEKPVPKEVLPPAEPKPGKKRKSIQTRLDPEPEPEGGPTEKPKEKPKEKQQAKPEKKPAEQPKPRPEKKPKAIKRRSGTVKTPTRNLVYEVRADGNVEGSFSSKAKAEALKKELKARGVKARVVGVFC